MANTRLKRAATPTLRVLCNPYAHLDHEGRPAGAILCDPHEHVPYSSDDEPRRFVGATMVVDVIEPAGRYTPAKHDRGWEFSPDPVPVPATKYYRQHILTGDLLAADVDTWKTIGCDPTTFRSPKDLLAESKARAIGHHAREYGEDAVPAETRSHWNEHLASAPVQADTNTSTPKSVSAKARTAPADGGN